MKDPIVQELHAIRETMAEECGHDFERLLKRQQQIMTEWRSSQRKAQPATPAVPSAAPCAQVAEDGGPYETGRGRPAGSDQSTG